MTNREWAQQIVQAGYRECLKRNHPDGTTDAAEKARREETAKVLAVTRDELNALIESTQYQAQPSTMEGAGNPPSPLQNIMRMAADTFTESLRDAFEDRRPRPPRRRR